MANKKGNESILTAHIAINYINILTHKNMNFHEVFNSLRKY